MPLYVTYLVGNRFNLFRASTVLYMYIIIDIVDKVGRILFFSFLSSPIMFRKPSTLIEMGACFS
jgi:hypothetical protein